MKTKSVAKEFPVVCVGGIDFVLSPEDIAKEIVRIARVEPPLT